MKLSGFPEDVARVCFLGGCVSESSKTDYKGVLRGVWTKQEGSGSPEWGLSISSVPTIIQFNIFRRLQNGKHYPLVQNHCEYMCGPSGIRTGCRGGSRYVEGCWGISNFQILNFQILTFQSSKYQFSNFQIKHDQL